MLTMGLDKSWNNSNKSFANVRSYDQTGIGNSDFHNVSTGNVGQRISKGIGLDHVWTLSPSRVLDLRFNLTRYEEPGIDNGSGFNPTELGFLPGYVSQMERPS